VPLPLKHSRTINWVSPLRLHDNTGLIAETGLCSSFIKFEFYSDISSGTFTIQSAGSAVCSSTGGSSTAAAKYRGCYYWGYDHSCCRWYYHPGTRHYQLHHYLQDRRCCSSPDRRWSRWSRRCRRCRLGIKSESRHTRMKKGGSSSWGRGEDMFDNNLFFSLSNLSSS